MLKQRSKINAFSWYGGKFLHLNWLLPILDTPCKHFVDVFGGSAAVILNRSPSPIETYNDIDSGLVNFFKVVRDDTAELIRVLSYTPYSREEFITACDKLRDGVVPTPRQARIEHARMYFLRARMAFMGKSQKAKQRDWSNSHKDSHGGRSGAVNKYHNSIDTLSAIANRLLQVQIENSSATKLIQRLDRPDTLFYCDPPYLFSTREKGNCKCYSHEMTDDDHAQLAEVLNQCQGKVAISYYDHELMLGELYPRNKWRRHYTDPRKLNGSYCKKIVQEMVLTNYK